MSLLELLKELKGAGKAGLFVVFILPVIGVPLALAAGNNDTLDRGLAIASVAFFLGSVIWIALAIRRMRRFRNDHSRVGELSSDEIHAARSKLKNDAKFKPTPVVELPDTDLKY